VARERLLSVGKVIRVVVTVPLGQHLYGHAEIARGLP
jgi:hypothetical protein